MSIGKYQNITQADLEDGKFLEERLAEFLQDSSMKHLHTLLAVLRSSFVWIPCRKVLSEAEQEGLDEVCLVQDQLESGKYLPVFSSPEQMKAYGNSVSKVKRSMLQAIFLEEKNTKDLRGIVLNVFSDPFVMEKDLLEIIIRMVPLYGETADSADFLLELMCMFNRYKNLS